MKIGIFFPLVIVVGGFVVAVVERFLTEKDWREGYCCCCYCYCYYYCCCWDFGWGQVEEIQLLEGQAIESSN